MLQDLPSVIKQAGNLATSLSSAITLISHDFLEPQPKSCHGTRIYYLHHIIHDWEDEESLVILKHVRDAMRAGHSRLLIQDHVLSDVGASWVQTSLDWAMLAMLGARERTESEWHELLVKAGLRINGIWQKFEGSESVIEAVRDDE